MRRENGLATLGLCSVAYFDVSMLNVWLLLQVNLTLQEEREISVQYSALVNKAYAVLLQPLTRGLYMLHLHGINVEDTTDTDPQFLADVMETNEELTMAQNPNDVRRLESANKNMIDTLTR